MEKKSLVKVMRKSMCEIEVSSKDTIMAYSQNSKSSDNNTSTKSNQVSAVMLFGVPIVSLVMEGKERLCLAQISSTLLKEFSYNEIHNRRVALGITCIQCTPVQLEILRRAGAMPVTSRRCGMITRREAERLCQSFLGDHAPPQLPENFAFDVYHECAWGCRGHFVPSRYNSSRAKCIRCSFCQLFFSPNKFIFHSHRLPDSRYIQPDAANFNSWRRHLRLCGDPPEDVSSLSPSQFTTPQASGPSFKSNTSSDPIMSTAQYTHAWEDVKAMFNGGTRKRLLAAHSIPSPHLSVKRSSPPKVSPHGVKVNQSLDPPVPQVPISVHGGNDTGGCYTSPPPGPSPPFLCSGIWNPGISNSNLSDRCSIDHALPIAIHPLSIPWLRRPLFPFSHPFGPSCKYLGDGNLASDPGPIPSSIRLPNSAFKPVSHQSSPVEFFNNWLTNSATLPPNFIQIPEDLSLSSASSTTSPIFLQDNNARVNSKTNNLKFDTRISSVRCSQIPNQNLCKRDAETVDENSNSTDVETTVDVESTDSEGKHSQNNHEEKRVIKRPCLSESSEEVDVDSSDEVDVGDDTSSLQQHKRKCYSNNNHSNGKKKKRLWDFDVRHQPHHHHRIDKTIE